jgi:DNA-binding transcriptional LysR family regulator
MNRPPHWEKTMNLQSLPDLDIKVLIAFDEIWKHQSLTAAAATLGITQSAISKYLQRMREQLSDPLFVRAPKSMRMEPTPRAQRLRDPVQEILRAYFEQIAVSPSFDPLSAARVFAIHASDLGLSVLLPILTAEVALHAPKCRIKAVSACQRDVLEGLEAGAIDLSISAFVTLSGIQLYQQRICEEDYVILVDKDHPLARAREPLDREAFLSQTHILVSASGSGHAHGRAEACLLDALSSANIAMEVPSFLVGMVMLQGSCHVLTTPNIASSHLATRFGLVSLRCPLPLPSIKISQYWHERFSHDPACQWLRKLIHDAVSSIRDMRNAEPSKMHLERVRTTVGRACLARKLQSKSGLNAGALPGPSDEVLSP